MNSPGHGMSILRVCHELNGVIHKRTFKKLYVNLMVPFKRHLCGRGVARIFQGVRTIYQSTFFSLPSAQVSNLLCFNVLCLNLVFDVSVILRLCCKHSLLI